MAAIAASGVTYTAGNNSKFGSKDDNSVREETLKIVFGDGTATYPAGGIPLSNLSKWGFPNVVSDVLILDASNGDGYDYKWDKVNNKLRIYNPLASHTHALFLNNADVVDGATTRVNAGTNLLGANTGTDISVAGVPDLTGHGGVVNAAGAPGGEVATTFAPAASTTLYIRVRGH